VNYYEHHIGDYAEATAHLSIVEDGIYSRLLRKYYATEQPLPIDKRKLARWVGARSKEETAALDLVLEEFFTLEDDGYHQARCDRAITEFHEGEPERDLKRANERNRNQNHRAERSKLFKQLTDAGGHAAWNIGMAELRALVRSVAGPPTKPPATPQVVDFEQPATAPATAPATPDTATHTPLPRHHYPNIQRAHVLNKEGGGQSIGPDGPARAGFEKPSPESAAQAMAGAGLGDCSPGNPTLLALLQGGITLPELVDAAGAAAKVGKSFAWALARAEGKRRDAVAAQTLPPVVSALTDPDSRASVEASARQLGVAEWDQTREQWPAFKARVVLAREVSREAA
jgi:uncharacterized protein YdaU (DUF1376 family)